MSMGKYGYVMLATGKLGAYRPQVLAVSLDEDGAVTIDQQRGSIDPYEGCVIWKLFAGDRVSVVIPARVPLTTDTPQALSAEHAKGGGLGR